MEEENQVTTKDPAGKRLAEENQVMTKNPDMTKKLKRVRNWLSTIIGREKS